MSQVPVETNCISTKKAISTEATSLKQQLKDWADADEAQYCLGRCLGIFDEEFQDVKWIFWSDNHLGQMLYSMLEELVKQGILENNADLQFRWKKTVNTCPRCGKDPEFGYGYGFGVGIGSYAFCECGWQHKKQDLDCLLPGESRYYCQCELCKKPESVDKKKLG